MIQAFETEGLVGAGSAAAVAAQRAGFRTALIDAAERGRDKTCGDGLTPRAVHSLRELGLEPLLSLRLRSGEGVGACLAASLVLQTLAMRRVVARTR